MAAIPRKSASILGGAITVPNGLVEGPAGSYAQGAVEYNLDPAVIQNLIAGSGSAWFQGFYEMLVQTGGGVNSPAYQTLQAIFLVLTQQIAYILQKGAGIEWDSTGNTGYWPGTVAARVNGAGVWGLYVVNQTAAGPITSDPLTDTNNWTPYVNTLKGPGICKAWVAYDGVHQTILASFNVSSVVRIGAGIYEIYFNNSGGNVFANNNYTFAGSCGTQDGQTISLGDNNSVNGGAVGQLGVHNATKCRVYAWDPGNQQNEDTQFLSVNFFGM